ncbi:hypothetical protein [Enterococcus mundtii]|uniref:hypothetical protein n=1 Tax=Enterococcus mundtii TaxID=53346 RepID=UPI0035C6DA46
MKVIQDLAQRTYYRNSFNFFRRDFSNLVDTAVAALKVAQDRLDDLSLEQRKIIAAIRTE